MQIATTTTSATASSRYIATNIGLDHMGPLWVSDVFTKGETHKTYIALFTCATTRMLHLELQPNLESDATIRAMKRTFARVGTPRFIISDNHKTFRSNKVRNFSTSRGITWKFILELAPHWGGFYERLNGLVKRSLRKVLGRAKLSYEQVETVLTEIEGILNSRPLGYVYDDDFHEPLTPSHLMFGRRLENKCIFNPTTDDDVTTPKRLDHLVHLLDRFWAQFSSEYLTQLREHEKHSSVNRRGVNVGDVLLISQRKTPRSMWPIGKVTRLVKSSDNIADILYS